MTPPRLTEQLAIRLTLPDRTRYEKRARKLGFLRHDGSANLSAYIRWLLEKAG